MAKSNLHWSLNPEQRNKVIAKIKEARTKQLPPNLGRKFSDAFKKKQSQIRKQLYWEEKIDRKFCRPHKIARYWAGKQRVEETKRKISQSLKGNVPWNKGKLWLERRGPNHHNWKGGITVTINGRVNNARWRWLRKEVYKRDQWECQVCGTHCHKSIQCHHILPSSEGGSDDKDNLVTLCKSDHLKIERSMNQEFWRFYLSCHIRISRN